MEDRKGLAKTEQTAVTAETSDRARSRTPENIWDEGDDFLQADDPRFNGHGSSVKRRKVDPQNASIETGQADSAPKPVKRAPGKAANSGPFIDESDSEDDMEAYRELEEPPPGPPNTHGGQPSLDKDDPASNPPADLPPLVREVTSDVEDDEFANFDDLEEDEPVGDEFRERPCGDEEQEVRLDDNDFDDVNGTDSITDTSVNACPICQKALTGSSEMVRIFTLQWLLHTNSGTGTCCACE